MPRLPAAIFALVVLLMPGTGHAQLVDDVLRTIDGMCAQLSRAKTFEELRQQVALISGMAQTLRGGMSPLLDVDAQITSADQRIATLRTRHRAIDREIAELRGQGKATGDLDRDIAWRTDKMLELQAARLTLHAGGNGQPGLDEIDRRLARIAADRFESNDDRAAARAQQPALEAARATLMARKAELASLFAIHQDERARLIAARGKINPNLARIEALGTERDGNAREIETLQEKLPALRQTADRMRLTASAFAAGMNDLKACAARREKELKEVATRPLDPPTPPTPPTATLPSFALSGTWSGRCTGFDQALSGPFTMSAANGTISGSFNGQYVSGRISGTVSPQGQLAAGGGNGSNLTVQWSGKIVDGGGKWSGSGQWTGNSGGSA